MKEQILKLRAEGKTYRQIIEIVGCSKSTVSYYCGEGQKEKACERGKRNRYSTRNKILRKIDNFIRRDSTGCSNYTKRGNINYEMYNKLIENPYCYLTGESVNFDEVSSYSLDHILPFSKGGDNSLENMGLALSKVNLSKTDLTVDEYIELCKKVCEHNGYEVKKK